VFLDAFVDPKGRPLFFGRTVCQAGATARAGEVETGGKVEVESEVGADRAGADGVKVYRLIN
jgi:hypothetical protein